MAANKSKQRDLGGTKLFGVIPKSEAAGHVRKLSDKNICVNKHLDREFGGQPSHQ
jgi:hypothetical protein